MLCSTTYYMAPPAAPGDAAVRGSSNDNSNSGVWEPEQLLSLALSDAEDILIGGYDTDYYRCVPLTCLSLSHSTDTGLLAAFSSYQLPDFYPALTAKSTQVRHGSGAGVGGGHGQPGGPGGGGTRGDGAGRTYTGPRDRPRPLRPPGTCHIALL